MKTTDIELGNRNNNNNTDSIVLGNNNNNNNNNIFHDDEIDTSKITQATREHAENPTTNDLGYWGLIMSLVVMLILWIICIILRFVEIEWGDIDCELNDLDDEANSMCIRQNAIYRVAAIVCIFFTLHAFISMYSVEAIFDHYWLTIKIPLILLASICLIVFNSDYFDDNVFVWWARIGGFIFIIFQQVILLDFAYMWNDRWFTNGQRTNNAVINNTIETSDFYVLCNSIWLLGLFIVALTLFVVFIVANALMYRYYGGPGCDTSNKIITISLIGMIAAGIIQLTSSHGSIITTAILMVYVAYVTYMSVSLNPDTECNPFADESNTNSYGSGPAIAGLLFSFISIVYMSTITTRAVSALIVSGDATNIVRGKTSGASSAPDYKKKLRSSVFFYNIVYAFVCLYLAMINTNWGLRIRSVTVANPHTSRLGMWMQASAAWIIIALYVVSLILPFFDFMPKSVWDFYPKSLLK
eukprot:TRINITY_DN66412_c9_g2_i2.p1 TRINITY_DN66412_c9_g2~~TRINITY_DN66412_c9_g2_i2.p1  ORF type:complete len:470 (+),score=-43.06 TRINITY_DN66412_c9_g2_i2:59-1468(+)